MKDCIFCKIAGKKLESESVYEDTDLIAFRDMNPVARCHVLIIPKKHIEGVKGIAPGDAGLVGRVFLAANKIAESENIDETGFRVLVNSGSDAGQAVDHLHFHLLGGERLKPI